MEVQSKKPTAKASAPVVLCGCGRAVRDLTMVNPYGTKSTPPGFSDTTKQSFSVTWSSS